MQLLKGPYQLSLHLNEDLCHNAFKASRERCRSSNTRVMKRSAVCKRAQHKCNITAVQKPALENRAQETLGYTSIAIELQRNLRVKPPFFLPSLAFLFRLTNTKGEGLSLRMSASPLKPQCSATTMHTTSMQMNNQPKGSTAVTIQKRRP